MIVTITGKVTYSITLDPGTWIFDDRRIDMDTYFTSDRKEVDEDEEYTRATGRFFDREIKEGAISPPTLNTERKYLKERLLTGSFGIKLEPFLKNAEPLHDAQSFILILSDGEIKIPLKKAYNLILAFSKQGKPLKEDGPIHAYFEDGSNKENPIKHVQGFRVE
ncbi:hypothetical protein [Heyndrickxia acidicola]|uniref:Peptidyl-prolyl cis-trans isomerase n=1 Tax=Heyndrickxia acidicola TaxID=209389 RepID=A0ABU6MIE7_9BACI|nr:hypothetical protein [Heyndrickxia acidicola]MED1204219.1 peptidyl-prolyl cis-trans isomerase [Heyndrickxia acidicola]